jgi:hypothetical protein
MPDAAEAAVADVAGVIEESRADYDMSANIPPPPEEPPDEFDATTDHRPPTAESAQKPVEKSTPSEAQSNGGASGNGSTPAAKAHGGKSGTVVHAPMPATTTHPESPRHLRIFLTRTNDHDEDVRRMRELLALLSSVDGQDRFTFYVPNPQGIVQLDFPNHKTSYVQVQAPLTQMVSGWGTLEVQ